MDDYNFWADFFDTFQSSPDWIKALWLIVPPAFILGLVALLVLLPSRRPTGRAAPHPYPLPARGERGRQRRKFI